LVLGMFAFGFALVPLYDLLCKVTGVQSVNIRATANQHSVESAETVDRSRMVTVKLDTTVNPSLSWNLSIEQPQLKVYPGEIYQVNFTAHNRSSKQVTGQAIPSIAPWQATEFFSKLDCFCFNRQILAGNETQEMPLRFMVSPNLPDDIKSLTLSYSFMKLTTKDAKAENPDIAAIGMADY